ncbi:MAG: hypothetical protein E6471_28855, partial [Bradyrhizobium sp.]|nr:hypothetical protein [Bradyrhizobium sp.]
MSVTGDAWTVMNPTAGASAALAADAPSCSLQPTTLIVATRRSIHRVACFDTQPDRRKLKFKAIATIPQGKASIANRMSAGHATKQRDPNNQPIARIAILSIDCDHKISTAINVREEQLDQLVADIHAPSIIRAAELPLRIHYTSAAAPGSDGRAPSRRGS